MELFKDIGADRMDRERVFRGDGGPLYTLWRPCFLACEDNNVPCWPVQQTNPNRKRFPYYGPRNYNIYGKKCVAPFFAYQILVNEEEKGGKQQTNSTIYLKIFRDEILYDKHGKPRIRNIFAHSKGRLMASDRCFTLGDLLHGMDKTARADMTRYYPLYHHVLSIGAGCFIETEHRKKVEYQACFPDCPCNRSLHEPAIFVENRCILEEKCNASRITDEEDDIDMVNIKAFRNTTRNNNVNPSNNTIPAPIILLVITFFSFLTVLVIAIVSSVKPAMFRMC